MNGPGQFPAWLKSSPVECNPILAHSIGSPPNFALLQEFR